MSYLQPLNSIKKISGKIIIHALIFIAISGVVLFSCRNNKKNKELTGINPQSCFECHGEIKDLWVSGKHKDKLNCIECHSNFEAHQDDPEENKVTVDLNLDNCGRCHKEQFNSLFTINFKKAGRLEKSLYTERSPNPLWDKLMMGHGFTKEHNTPRSHAYMLIDHLIVDRAYGGRFQPKNGWEYLIVKMPTKVWDIVEDKFPETKEHKPFLPETAAAAYPTCLQCKTSDSILTWKYLGNKGGKWDRTSNVVEYAKDIQNPMGCIHCHDPHSNNHRIIRDALIAAIERPEKDTLWHKDEKKTNIKIVNFRDGFRKIALLDKPDTKLQCGQCHVEYTCNAGLNPKTGEKIPPSDIRTNHFPMKDVFKIYEHYYNKLEFSDFKHSLTNTPLIKIQHPEVEVFWNSKHEKAGVNCNDCHMPKVKSKEGKEFTSHWQTSPKNYINQTCLKCHSKWTQEEAVYIIDSVKNYIKGKMRKAEFWLANLIDKIVEAKKLGIAEDIIKQAQEHHKKAHILWEWWTAENSDGFHNPEQARESLTKSIEESKKGIELLKQAIESKK